MTPRPFNLEEAKAGKPIVCRDGTPAKFIAHVPEAAPSHRLVTLRLGRIVSCAESGHLLWGNEEVSLSRGYSCDLFMAPIVKEAWINVYSQHINANHDGLPAFAWATRAQADAAADDTIRIACVKISYTEGEGL